MNKLQLLQELKQENFPQPILKAFEKIPRENFIPPHLKPYAYENEPLPIARGATISQPYTIAFMLNLLELDELIDNIKQNKVRSQASESSSSVSKNIQAIKNNQTTDANKSSLISDYNINNKIRILEIGSGCGYVLALINQICPNSEIYGIEINEELAKKSRQILKHNKNIKIIHGDGNRGIPNEKFDRILISAACDRTPHHLFKQIKRRGILVAPVRNSIVQVKKKNHSIIAREFPGFIFVPLIQE